MKQELLANTKQAIKELESNSANSPSSRTNALENLNALDIPNSKLEAWRYSNLKGFDLSKFIPVTNAASIDDASKEQKFRIPISTKNIINFSNGFLKDYSGLDTNIKLEQISLGKSNKESSFFKSLNQALVTSGVSLTIPKNTVIDEPIYLNYNTDTKTGNAFANQNQITVEESSKVTIIEQYSNSSTADNLLNTISKLNIAENAEIDYYIIQTSNSNGVNILNNSITLKKDSKLNITFFSIGNSLNHSDIKVELESTGIEVNTFIANNAKDKQNHNLNLITNHKAPHCISNTVYRAVLNDKSISSFTGDIIVDEGALQTNADLQCKSLVMSKAASANSRPQLVINCDDVKCSHGSSIGHLDEDALFYLRARGLPLKAAKELLVQAFIEPAIENIKLKEVQDFYRSLV